MIFQLFLNTLQITLNNLKLTILVIHRVQLRCLQHLVSKIK